MRILEQADRTVKEDGVHFTYSWILDGIKGNSAYAKQLVRSGWKWLPGRSRMPGCFVTDDEHVAGTHALRSGCGIHTNGTHVVSRAPAKLCPPQEGGN